ncbi:MAG: protein translocase subunit SecF [Ruminococcus sp.]|nr:protein translocase subunit SecF [Ruminococcus sp.]
MEVLKVSNDKTNAVTENQITVNSKKPIDFIGKRKIFFGISIAIILIGIICNFVFGTNLDIQFSGGAMIKYSYTGELDTEQMKNLIQSETPDNQVSFAITQSIMDSTADLNAYTVTVQFSGNNAVSTDLQSSLTSKLQNEFPDNNFKYLESNSVDSTMGFSFLLKCLAAVALASILMVIYVTLRFKKIGGFSAGVMGLVALFHDVAMIYFLYVIFRMPIDSNFIAVVLMILGYSLNDTIVVYDRVREEKKRMGYKADIADVFNVSCTKVMRRSIITSITTLAAIGVVYVVATIYGITSVQGFALPMMIGIISGCYSSLCIAGPLWVTWQKHKAKTGK